MLTITPLALMTSSVTTLFDIAGMGAVLSDSFGPRRIECGDQRMRRGLDYEDANKDPACIDDIVGHHFV